MTKKETNKNKINYKKELNPSQLKAVKTLKGPVLIVAGAGSGKTRTLIYRVARLVESGVDPKRILLLTFTRKASKEMLERASQILDKRCGKVSGGTFHGFANKILRQYANLVGFKKNFTIADRSDSQDIIGLFKTKTDFSNDKDDRIPKKSTIQSVLSKSVNKNEAIEDILEQEYSHFAKYSSIFEKIATRYKNYKIERNIMDFDDLLVYLKKLLEEHDKIRKKISRFYKYIMVDEYQDTNFIQAEIIKLLSEVHQNICVVGDDSQSIYSFRGADFRNIMDFPDIFPNTKVITLEQNYRSTQPILNLTNKIIEQAEEKFSKTLFTKKKKGKKPKFVELYNENHQSKYVTDKILELKNDKDVSLNQIAVLFRNGWHSNDLEVELAKRDIPFQKYGGFKFVESAHIKDIIAYLRVVYNKLDSVSWNRILLLIKGIGRKTADKLIYEIVENKKGFQGLVSSQFKSRKYSKDLAKLKKALSKAKDKDSIYKTIKTIINFYKPYFRSKYDDYNKRIDDFDSLLSISKRYKSMESFLSDLTLDPLESQANKNLKEKDEDQLTLSTIHSAKGLEWHSVFIISAVEGMIPSSYSIKNIQDLEEERRLFYVATTRAKENLFITKPEIRRSKFLKASRFLKTGNIIEEHTKSLYLVDQEKDFNDFSEGFGEVGEDDPFF